MNIQQQTHFPNFRNFHPPDRPKHALLRFSFTLKRAIQDTEADFHDNYRIRNAIFRENHAPKGENHAMKVNKNATERKKQSPEIANRSLERSYYPKAHEIFRGESINDT